MQVPFSELIATQYKYITIICFIISHRFWEESLLPISSCFHKQSCNCNITSYIINAGPSDSTKVRYLQLALDDNIIYVIVIINSVLDLLLCFFV